MLSLMGWNWEQPDWPNFSWKSERLADAEARFARKTGQYVGTVKHLASQDREQFMVQAMSTEALTTSAIEGEILDRASVQSSIQKKLGLATDKRKAKPAEDGVAAMMVDLYRNYFEPLSDEGLFAWHRLLMQGHHDVRDVGRYRTDPSPMQVVSGRIYEPRVHFEAPPTRTVPKQMKAFLRWFNGKKRLPVLTRAGIAHLYFVSIHPFEDGNGRIARAISEKSLAQSLGQPTLIALAATILARRKSYYDILEAANKKNEITPWLIWFADAAIEAQERSIRSVEFLIEKTRLLNRLNGQLNERQHKALLRLLKEGTEGFQGGLSASNYASITGASPATTTRDLADLVEKGALLRQGERRHARYWIAIAGASSPR